MQIPGGNDRKKGEDKGNNNCLGAGIGGLGNLTVGYVWVAA
jgi:hypothetical protein